MNNEARIEPLIHAKIGAQAKKSHHKPLQNNCLLQSRAYCNPAPRDYIAMTFRPSSLLHSFTFSPLHSPSTPCTSAVPSFLVPRSLPESPAGGLARWGGTVPVSVNLPHSHPSNISSPHAVSSKQRAQVLPYPASNVDTFLGILRFTRSFQDAPCNAAVSSRSDIA